MGHAGEAHSLFSPNESAPDTNQRSAFWSVAPPISFAADTYGTPQVGLTTDVRSRWTVHNLYLLFTCAYDSLYLKPHPDTLRETNELWNWDVVEAFLSSNSSDIRRYKEFEVSPQGEWVDLDVDLNKPNHEDGWVWSSGFDTAACIEADRKLWCAFMRIPYAAIDSRLAAPGNTLRANFCRTHGVERRLTVWQPTNCATFHVPEVFGVLRLERS